MMHTRPTHTPGGAQRDRQHPSWPESREEGEGGWGGAAHLPSLYSEPHTHTHTDGHTPPCIVLCTWTQNTLFYFHLANTYRSTEGVFKSKHYNTHFK